MILTWLCEFCGSANDNNSGPCRNCGGQTELRLINGHWRSITVVPPTTTKPTRRETTE
jgi:hypothetical protein